MNYRGIAVLLLAVLFLHGCKEENKKKKMNGDDTVAASDFVAFYDQKQLPFEIADTTLAKKDNDSAKISYKIFKQFVPDSVISKMLGKGIYAIYPIGRLEEENKEKYLVTKIIAGGKKTAVLIVMDADNNFAAAMPLLITDKSSSTRQSAVIDYRYTINKNVSRTNKDNSISEGKDVYVFNADTKDFTLIMTDPLNETAGEIINPIDTFSRKNKFAADYVKDKNNFVSVRDGRREGKVLFFIHMEKNGGDCKGELKGDAAFTNNTTAVYREPGDPCGLQFTFSKNAVTVEELEGCGNHRDLRCSFNARYPKKVIKTSTKNKKSKK